jgi:hypothetical protein
MGGIGISFQSQEEGVSPSIPLINLPQKVVDEIANQLGIISARQELAETKIALPDDTEVAITRLSNKDPLTNSLTLTKLGGGTSYRLKCGNTTVDITP